MTANAQGHRKEAHYDKRPNPDWLAFDVCFGHTPAARDMETRERCQNSAWSRKAKSDTGPRARL